MARWAYILAGLAALSGAAGIAELAGAAHLISDPLLKTSANFLLINAVAVIALSALLIAGGRPAAGLLFAATILLCGSVLFGGEVSAHVFLGRKIVPLAVPVGGGLTILGWLTAAIAASARAFRQRTQM